MPFLKITRMTPTKNTFLISYVLMKDDVTHYYLKLLQNKVKEIRNLSNKVFEGCRHVLWHTY